MKIPTTFCLIASINPCHACANREPDNHGAITLLKETFLPKAREILSKLLLEYGNLSKPSQSLSSLTNDQVASWNGGGQELVVLQKESSAIKDRVIHILEDFEKLTHWFIFQNPAAEDAETHGQSILEGIMAVMDGMINPIRAVTKSHLNLLDSHYGNVKIIFNKVAKMDPVGLKVVISAYQDAVLSRQKRALREIIDKYLSISDMLVRLYDFLLKNIGPLLALSNAKESVF